MQLNISTKHKLKWCLVEIYCYNNKLKYFAALMIKYICLESKEMLWNSTLARSKHLSSFVHVKTVFSMWKTECFLRSWLTERKYTNLRKKNLSNLIRAETDNFQMQMWRLILFFHNLIIRPQCTVYWLWSCIKSKNKKIEKQEIIFTRISRYLLWKMYGSLQQILFYLSYLMSFKSNF